MSRLRANLFLRFAVVSFVVTALIAMVLAIVLAFVLSSAIRSEAVNSLAQEAIANSSGRLLRAITPADLATPMTGERYNQFHQFVQESIVSERTARVKIWAKDGTVVYSNDPAGVGAQFSPEGHLLKALGGETAISIKIPKEPEHGRERFLGTLMEVYTPIIFPGTTEPAGAFEIYQYYAPTAQLIKNLQFRLFWSLAVGFTVLYAALGVIARQVWRRIMQQETALVTTERLASVGELASGIAHELNNPLTSVIGFSELLLEKDVPDDVKEDLKTINKEAQRTAQIVKNLLTFARKHPEVKQSININEVIPQVLELRTYEQKINNIEVDTRLAAGLPEVMTDSFQLQQVFLNIIINAEYFMIEAHKRGTLTITTERIDNFVRASFADDGPGIPPENLGRVFDPFFTTKAVGKGTGLGLSICHGIVTEHGGRIYAESELGKGATFIVELPVGTDSKGTNK